MLDGVMLLWFLLTALSLAFVAVDIRSTPESAVLKWGFVLITAYTGPLGAFLYVLGCREPLPGLHERYVAVRWRQVLGSTMHCVAGDGVGILAGAVIASLVQLPPWQHVVLEYALGFAFGWAIFQALFMRGTAGGSYGRALATTFMPELLSMNALMAGMVPVATVSMAAPPERPGPADPAFWFTMSMALLAGAVVAYPINWWLVSRRLKHGMMTVRRREARLPTSGRPASMGHEAPEGSHAEPAGGHRHTARDAVSWGGLLGMTAATLTLLAGGIALAGAFGGL